MSYVPIAICVLSVFKTMQPLLANPQVTKLHYSNESQGHAPAELQGDERYSFVTFYEMEAGHEWKIDMSFWLSEKPRAQLAHLEYLSERLTEETRLAILWIKDYLAPPPKLSLSSRWDRYL